MGSVLSKIGSLKENKFYYVKTAINYCNCCKKINQIEVTTQKKAKYFDALTFSDSKFVCRIGK